ncbi:hypothetical protein AA0113_g12679 [Alternaria arborescens]|uniref:Alcohol dehydrogenase-like C-terminal domain-containing protein n=1 Tax=Alternaria arborescens TaxID=156630 RepID=A0A4Q4PWI0_9PLEO|nr:hypothetical protein AA0113_g12679 [Alternaria arborescens]
MAVNQNFAAWLPGVGKQIEIGHADISEPGPGELLVENKKVLIWGASSSFGTYATQLAARAGYSVIGVASSKNAKLVESFGAARFVDRESPTVIQELADIGRFEAVLAAADSAQDQVLLGAVLAAQGGGSFLTTMGVRAGVELSSRVSGFFRQFVDDYLNPRNAEFTQWVWWDFLESEFASGELKLVPVQVIGGLNKVQEAWDLLKKGKVSGQRLAIAPDL